MNSPLSPKASFYNNILIFEICGIWIPEHLGVVKKRAYILYVVCFSIVIYYSYLLSQVINLFLVTDNLEEFAESTFVFITVFAETIKAVTVQIQQRRIKKLLHELDGETFMPKTSDGRKLLEQGLQKIKYIFRLFICLYDGTVVLWGIFPFLDSEKRYSLPLKAWYPFALDSSPSYELGYLHQFVATILLATLNASLDTTIICLMIHAIIQLNILLATLMGGYAGYVRNHPDPPLLNEEQNKMLYLKKCVIHHSTMLPRAAYFSDWYEQNKQYCRSLQIFMIRASRPIQITGGYFFALSLNTFTTILRSAWSYFTLLKQVHSENEE
ncbi:Odorant receptor 47a [Carabus blaptoides fortunei]